MADLNVRIPEELMADVRTLHSEMAADPHYGPMRLSQTALVRLALSKGLESIRREAGEPRTTARKKKR